MARNTSRPMSPHVFNGPFRLHYHWGPHMTVSILNRAMGIGLATVGTAMLVWWLVALASGPEAYAICMGFMRSWYGMIFPIGLTFAFFLHLCAGLRHFVMDTGAGFELVTNRMWAWGSMIAPVLLTGAVWIFIARRML
jgi:succinate dehydrogenase / fumarate reductase, cytochrome b subunit